MQEFVDWLMVLLPDVPEGVPEAAAAFLTLVFTLPLVWIAYRELRHQIKVRLQDTEPCVVVGLAPPPERGAGVSYVAINVGAGPAFNSFFLSDLSTDTAKVVSLGPIPSGQSVILPNELDRDVGDQMKRFMDQPFYLVCQSADGRWAAVVSRLDRNGRPISERRRKWRPSARLEAQMFQSTMHERLAAAYGQFVERGRWPEGTKWGQLLKWLRQILGRGKS